MVNFSAASPRIAERRVRELGIELPAPPNPLGAYVPGIRSGNLLYLSGMLPISNGEPQFLGQLGRELDIERGRAAARLCALNALGNARKQLGTLDKVANVVRVAVYLATGEHFTSHAKVADGASELLRDVFGENKLPVRVVLGVATLPLGVPVEVEVLFQVDGNYEEA